MKPINGWIFNIKRYALHDGPGIRTTVFFQGCPLHCPWCHNPESRFMPGRGIRGDESEQISLSKLMNLLEKDRLFFDQSNGGITISGGEPLAQPDFLSALLEACHERDLHVTVDTCGHGEPSRSLPILQSADLILFDLKILDPRGHQSATGVGIHFIQANLEGIFSHEVPLRLRFPLIPGHTDSPGNISALCQLVFQHAQRIEEISILPFHPAAAHKYQRLGIRNPLEGRPEVTDQAATAVLEQLRAVHPKVRIGG